MIVFSILSPFVLAPLAALVGARWAKHARWLAIGPALLTLFFGLMMRRVAVEGPVGAAIDWAPALGLTLQFNLDGLGLLFAILIAGIGSLVVLYGTAYLKGHADLPRFLATLFAFMGAMLGVVLADNLFALFVFWELTGFTSFLLIGFEHDKSAARAAALQALIVTGAGGMGLFAAAVLFGQITGETSISGMLASGADVRAHGLYPACALLVMAAAFTKSAQVPLHFWLPGAMAAPTPVSAYLHSATMVKAGVYLLARMTPVLGDTPFWTSTLVVVGSVTMLGGAWRSVQEVDLKRILAYTTVSSLGALVLLIGIGTPTAILAALVYLVAHACYKGALFMVAGIVDHEAHTRDVTELGGLRRAMPRTALAAALAAASMLGVPLTFGFLGKELFYEAAMHQGTWAGWVTAVAVTGSALAGASGLVAGFLPFAGAPRDRLAAVHEAPWPMWIGPLALGVTGVASALIPVFAGGAIGLAVAGVTRVAAPVHLALWHGPTPVLGLSLLTLAIAAAIYAARATVRRYAWPRSLHTSGLYDLTVGVLDRVSAIVSPSLYNASLRSYVFALIVTSGTLLAAVLLHGGGGWSFARTTDVRPHEAMVALLICVAAVVAARATSSMRAVIALGAVGYGVALLFVSFGAPDLAMTQFSVETLTVVIFVLVFRTFGSFGHLSTRLVRARDALVAAALGVIVSTLVLFVGVNGKVSRLSDFFVDAGPTLAHGRNIVNVILVDFRAFDTMGEITVLVVAAIGVHALLRISADERGRP